LHYQYRSESATQDPQIEVFAAKKRILDLAVPGARAWHRKAAKIGPKMSI
jgi:hypothetical protein